MVLTLLAVSLSGKPEALLGAREADPTAQTYKVDTSRSVLREANVAGSVAQTQRAGHPGDASRATAALPALVRVERLTTEALSDKSRDRQEEGSAVVIAGRRLLTHGHYCSLGDPALLSEVLLLTVSVKGFLTDVRLPIESVAIAYADTGTALLAMPGFVPLPREAARLGDPTLLQPGDLLTIHYWDDAGQRFAALETTITEVAGGTARVADPDNIIGPGDSGGPVFNARDELVGNVWSIVYHDSGARMPYAQVALLPAAIRDDV
jgi:S1-C subfamily serine protease